MDIPDSEWSYSNDADRTPSPVPFKEPEGMVTIDLNQQSACHQVSKLKTAKPKRVDSYKLISYISFILLLCSISFLGAYIIHQEEFRELFPNWLSNVDEKIKSERLQLKVNTEIPVDAETCPADFLEALGTQMFVCENTRKFKDCCHALIRTNLKEVNEICSIIELLDLLVQFKKFEQEISTIREKRHSEHHQNELEEKQESKRRTKEKLMSYLQHLNEPLRKEIPALWTWAGEMFLGFEEGEDDQNSSEHGEENADGENHSGSYNSNHGELEGKYDKNTFTYGSSKPIIIKIDTEPNHGLNKKNFEDLTENLDEKVSPINIRDDSEGTQSDHRIKRDRMHYYDNSNQYVPEDSGSFPEHYEDVEEIPLWQIQQHDIDYPYERFHPHHDQEIQDINELDKYGSPAHFAHHESPNKQENMQMEDGKEEIDYPPHFEHDDIANNIGSNEHFNEIPSGSYFHPIANGGHNSEQFRSIPRQNFVPEQAFETSDSIQEIENIHANNKSVKLDMKNTRITLSKNNEWKNKNLGRSEKFETIPETEFRSSVSTESSQISGPKNPFPISPGKKGTRISPSPNKQDEKPNPTPDEVKTRSNFRSSVSTESSQISGPKNPFPISPGKKGTRVSPPKSKHDDPSNPTEDDVKTRSNVETNHQNRKFQKQSNDSQSVISGPRHPHPISPGKKGTRVIFSTAQPNLENPTTEPEADTTTNDYTSTDVIDTTTLHDSERGSSNGGLRKSSQQPKGNPFPSLSAEDQDTQNSYSNPCIYTPVLSSPYGYAVPYDNRQIFNVVPPRTVQKSMYVMNPTVYPYVPPMIPMNGHMGYSPYSYVNTNPSAATNNGQYYLCNPLTSTVNGNHVANIPGVEIRKSFASNLQESIDEMDVEENPSNRSRAALSCPFDEQSCSDGSKCISLRHFCDNEVHCGDGSDELFCSCKDRVGEIRLCDGYFDCPNGEDERGCFGCSEEEFSCDDWNRFRRGTCVPLEQRCDGIKQCEVTGKDEEDCSALTDHLGEKNTMKISNAVGFLHRNFKGKWYPSCLGSELWAIDVCKIEAGPISLTPKSQMIFTKEKYDGEFINILPNQEISLVNTCIQDRASFVECPPLYCGLRMTVRNPYRNEEVDTSAEEVLIHLSRGSSRQGKSKKYDPVLGNERVVGGKPSQPAAWPWVVSIYKNGIFHCGGVIINELWIVTAAHCVDKYWQFHYEIQVGIVRRFSFSPMEQTRWATAAIPHEEYNKSNLKNDIALMRLSSPVRYNRYVRPICLPSEATAGREFLRGPAPGTICTTVGWGATVEHGTDPDHLREVEVPVLKRCKHREDEEGNEICAGLFEGGKDACQGDSGGPFMCQNPNNPSQWYLAGIVSHGEGCARPNEPGVYTRVSQYIGWIAEKMRNDVFIPRAPLQRCPGFVCKGTKRCIPKKRHCDKIVDCLMGDDEVNCENSFHNIFEHSRNFEEVLGNSKDVDEMNVSKGDEDIVGAFIINADQSGNIETNTDNEKKVDVVYNYEKKKFSNNNTEDASIFKCEKLLQIVPISKRCDKIVDCEDGTDEERCSCVDYLKLNHSDAICDGLADCADQSDESFCFNCNSEEYNCKFSQMCISTDLRCDGKPDCRKGEDEWDCVALTDGKNLVLDDDLRPVMNTKGIVTINRSGVWKPYCKTTSKTPEAYAGVASNTCNYLGFEGYIGFKKMEIGNSSLNIQNYNSKIKNEVEVGDVENCTGLYILCSNISLNTDSFKISSRNIEVDSDELYDAPWNAAIFGDGNYQCMGAVLNSQWIVTSAYCFDGILISGLAYIAASLGKGRRNLDVSSPHEENLRIIKSIQVNDTDIVLLKLERLINFNRYIQPISLTDRISDKVRDEKCMAIGEENGKTSYTFLKSNQTQCEVGKKCFNPIPKNRCHENGRPWSGVISCYSRSGWYPASVFYTENGKCGFEKITKFTSLKHWSRKITNLQRDNATDTPLLLCDGFRCKLGKCIRKTEICDGIPHCSTGEDEATLMCENRNNSCHLSKTCSCPLDHLKCANGNCVPKEKFCDRNNDCGDFSDEPSLCTCRAYLLVTHPEKVCDGQINCLDRSDEDPLFCPCKLTDMKCERSSLCVTKDMICDDVPDCPGGEDEKKCYSFRPDNSSSNSGEVLKKVAGQLLTENCFEHSPSKSKLKELCKEFGFKSYSNHRLTLQNSTIVPTVASFDGVWIRRTSGKGMPLMYGIRTGNDPYLSPKKLMNCNRLFIECN